MPEMIGAATLVPPSTSHAGGVAGGTVSEVCVYTATPVLGSATAATSATVRPVHPVSCCQLGLSNTKLQPLPAKVQAVSVQPRKVNEVVSVVPPTAVTAPDDDGHSTPRP